MNADQTLEFLTLLVSTVIGGLFAVIWRLWARMNNVEARLAQAENAIFESQQVCNIFGLAYESTRLLGLQIVGQFRDFLGRNNQPEPLTLIAFDAKPSLDVLSAHAQEVAREATRRRNSNPSSNGA